LAGPLASAGAAALIRVTGTAVAATRAAATARDLPGRRRLTKKAVPAAKPNGQPPTPQRIATNGHLASAAKDAAARAKATVDKASNPVSRDAALPSAARTPVSVLVAVAVSLLALVLVRRLRRRTS